MDFDFPDELHQLRAEARRFLADRCPPAAARRALDSGTGIDRTLWTALADMGWLGAALPERHGGAGLGHLALCVLSEEIGRALAPLPWASSVCLGAEAIAAHGSPAQQARLLPALAAGTTIATFAFAERPGPADPRRLTAEVADNRLSGRKCTVPDGMQADVAVVAVQGGAGPWLWLVDLAGPGVSRAAADSIDPSRPHATLDFVAAPAEPLPGATGAEAIRRLLDRAAVLGAFEQLGTAEAALEMACAYAKQRFAFGRQIGSFQAIKHKLADLYIAIELARSNAYYGAWALEKGAAELPIAAAVARIAACEAGWLATKENIQTHGGMGFTWAFDCHLYYRRARDQALALGAAREWKHRLIEALASRNAPARAD
jgi:alkylation response protein AidB-like acyl-CoA dehydrogenase